jgi:hypothetical protein
VKEAAQSSSDWLQKAPCSNSVGAPPFLSFGLKLSFRLKDEGILAMVYKTKGHFYLSKPLRTVFLSSKIAKLSKHSLMHSFR